MLYHQEYSQHAMPQPEPMCSNRVNMLTSAFNPTISGDGYPMDHQSFYPLPEQQMQQPSQPMQAMQAMQQPSQPMPMPMANDNNYLGYDNTADMMWLHYAPLTPERNLLNSFPPLSAAYEAHFNDIPMYYQNNSVNPADLGYPVDTLVLRPHLKPEQRKRSSSVPPAFHSDLYQAKLSHHQPPLLPTLTKPLPTKIDRVPAAPAVQKPKTQSELDDQLQKVNFDDVTVAELKEMLRDRGMSAAGRKAELLQRLRDERDAMLQQKQQYNNTLQPPPNPMMDSPSKPPSQTSASFSPASSASPNHECLVASGALHTPPYSNYIEKANNMNDPANYVNREPYIATENMDWFNDPALNACSFTMAPQQQTTQLWDDEELKSFLSQM
ncbi:uncharacterized protein BYT42DRAFT_392613 [Radiomyces spectabilis]|uniref:uncharacterized protein n=1 Tax=Radiomyces spectabilis TaxID=64574 RepID=UPI0022207F1E|nr:uncharacterized protein BYT42DRAFT_392613 [Radiomyces spectabilis]KAI8374138.1 hypothetical protein BYT42DRAFT_392613 [Radiomyces spectabilis]